MSDEENCANIKRYEFVTNSDKFICIGETNGSFNYILRDSVYSSNKKFIPVRNGFGGIDYTFNPNYKKK